MKDKKGKGRGKGGIASLGDREGINWTRYKFQRNLSEEYRY